MVYNSRLRKLELTLYSWWGVQLILKKISGLPPKKPQRMAPRINQTHPPRLPNGLNFKKKQGSHRR